MPNEWTETVVDSTGRERHFFYRSKYTKLVRLPDPHGCGAKRSPPGHRFQPVNQDKDPGNKACIDCGVLLYVDAKKGEFSFVAPDAEAEAPTQVPKHHHKGKHGGHRPNIRSSGQERA